MSRPPERRRLRSGNGPPATGIGGIDRGGAPMDVRRSLSGSTEDLAAGQVVIVAARWVLIGAGFVFALWQPGKLNELRVQLLVLFLLGLVNFYLQAQAMMRRKTLSEIVYAASAADIVVISLLVYA